MPREVTRAQDPATTRMVASVVRDGEPDELAVEEPLEIRVDGEALSVTMRTPGNDEELAIGFLIGEGLIRGPARAGLIEDLAANVINVEGPLLRDPGERRFYTSSSCGVCGKGALEEVAVHAPRVEGGPTVARSLLATLPDRLRQPTFARTGGLHATGLFDSDGELLIVREDVGRHNAMDKVVGRANVVRAPHAARPHPLRQRPAVVRARPEGGRRRRPDHGGRGGAVVARRRAGGRPQHHPRRLRSRGRRKCLHRGRSGHLTASILARNTRDSANQLPSAED